MRGITRGLATASVLACAGAAQAQYGFHGLSSLPGYTSSYGTGVSADGSTATLTLTSIQGIYRAARWTSGGGVQDLGTTFGEISVSTGASGDGSIVVGWDDGILRRGMRWTQGTGPQTLGTLPGGVNSVASGISANGQYIVGASDDGTTNYAVRWGPSGIQNLGTIAGATGSEAHGTNADGSVVIGMSLGTNSQATRWTEATGMQGLGVLPGESLSVANAVSADGNTVVGGSWLDASLVGAAWRWTPTDGIQSLGTFPGYGAGATARAVSADGSVIVGQAFSRTLNDEVAFVWTSSAGMVPLRDILLAQGVDITGWRIRDATGISADGMTIVGTGVNAAGNTEAWMATIPAPGTMTIGLAGVLAMKRRRGR